MNSWSWRGRGVGVSAASAEMVAGERSVCPGKLRGHLRHQHALARLCSLLVASFCVALVAGAAVADDGGDHDPWMSFNRAIFTFNDKLDIYILEPLARGWDHIVPKDVQTSLSHFFNNVRYPRVALYDLLQGKPRDSASDVGRFLVNTTIGLAGFFDPATDWGMERHDEDFGQTLGVWGVPSGPYLVLPFWGPSNPRDTVGLGVDSLATVYWIYAPLEATLPMTVVDTVNFRAQTLDTVRDIKEASFDYYTAVRNGYLQRRQAQIEDRRGISAEQDENLYKLNDEE